MPAKADDICLPLIYEQAIRVKAASQGWTRERRTLRDLSVTAVHHGCEISAVARSAGVSRARVYAWLEEVRATSAA